MKKGHTRRIRVTLSLPADLVRKIEKRAPKGVSRSRQFQRELEQKLLDEEIRAYYAAPPTEEEEALSKAIGRLGAEAIAAAEREDEERAARKRVLGGNARQTAASRRRLP